MKPVHFSPAEPSNCFDSNPQNVLRSIGAAGSPLSSSNQMGVTPPPIQPSVVDEAEPAPSLRLVVAPDSNTAAKEAVREDDVLQTTIESAKQIQQLASRLKQTQHALAGKESELADQESRLAASMRSQETLVGRQQERIDRQFCQLQQQASQVRLQQQHVMQLQSDIVDSNEAVKIAIEQLVANELTDNNTLRQMRAIQHQVSARFDFISRRWQQLYERLENQRVQLESIRTIRKVA